MAPPPSKSPKKRVRFADELTKTPPTKPRRSVSTQQQAKRQSSNSMNRRETLDRNSSLAVGKTRHSSTISVSTKTKDLSSDPLERRSTALSPKKSAMKSRYETTTSSKHLQKSHSLGTYIGPHSNPQLAHSRTPHTYPRHASQQHVEDEPFVVFLKALWECIMTTIIHIEYELSLRTLDEDRLDWELQPEHTLYHLIRFGLTIFVGSKLYGLFTLDRLWRDSERGRGGAFVKRVRTSREGYCGRQQSMNPALSVSSRFYSLCTTS
ncbi:hypothetical protein BDV95DRAFT_568525 [Massariosphaeria phaeospora]|uniref:Uncharacterized protein n=1 Tax=Massariosphaeria phaeospora TaxID=100035 RepID=A0A7C8ME31_9PLEO|nr:hypothetical protein BDV95DRAFT_568525 [Massariosphaeria phaeospora]